MQRDARQDGARKPALPANEHLALNLLIFGFQVSRMIGVIAELALADRLGPTATCPARELADACGVLEGPLMRILRALAAFSIFAITPDGRVRHTPRSLLLRKDAANSLQSSARFRTSIGSWRAWESIDAALHGAVPQEAAWGKPRFEYLLDHADEARVFDDFMASYPNNQHGIIAAAYDFAGARSIVDLGGGSGEVLREILVRFPKARGLVLDRSDVIRRIPMESALAGRLTTQAGNFFDEIPLGADVYMLVRVLHDWDDDAALRILQVCRSGIGGNARLLVVENVLEVDPSKGHPVSYLVDTHMMAMYGSGRERTQAEFCKLLNTAGFVLHRTISTASPVSIMEAAPN